MDDNKKKDTKSEKELNGVDEHDDVKPVPSGTADDGMPSEEEGGVPVKDVEEGNIKPIDADSIIDAFLEENPDLVDVEVENWPKEALDMLKETFNSEHIDVPNGVLPDEEDAGGEPIDGEYHDNLDENGNVIPLDDPETGAPAEDFDIAELAKLVEAGDKDGAWAMLQNMFGVQAPVESEPTNALGRMTEQQVGGGGNALARLMADLKF